MRNQSCLLCLLLAITLLFTVFPKLDAHAVDLIASTGPILEAGISSPTVLIATDDLVVPDAIVVIPAACNPNDPDHDCDASIADRCSAKKLKAAARYCQNAMHAQSTELRGSPRKAARKLSRARARFHRAWNSAQAAAAKAGESCSETGQDFGNVASGIDVAASSYADMASSNLDTAQPPGRSCASGRIRHAARLCRGLLLAEQKYYAAGTQNDPELTVLTTTENKVVRRFERNWSRLPRQCGATEIGEVSENAVMSLAENTRLQITVIDTDGDGVNDTLDLDDDGDTWTDAAEESCNTDPLSQDSVPSDFDNDMTCDLVDNDDDGDGTEDAEDAFPLDPFEQADTDSDGTGDNADVDDDGDGWLDADEVACATGSLDSDSTPTDTDSDGLCDIVDADADGNGATDDVPASWLTVDYPVGAVIEYDGMELSPICSQGTPWSLFARAGTVNKLLVYYQGGGACWNDLTCILETFDTNVETDPEAGGSDHPTRQTSGLANLENPNNPFRDWHVVFVPYCTGDVHWGDTEVDYEFNGTETTIHHKGAINAMTAERWISDHFLGPEQVFVTGSSAGAYGAVTHSVRLQELFPDAQFDVVGDGGNGVVTRDFLMDYLSVWGFEKHLPEEVPELNVPLGELDMSGVYEAIAKVYPGGRFATYTSAFDGGGGSQIFFYHIMKNADNSAAWGNWWESGCEWNAVMRELNQSTAAAVPNFRYYVGVGSAHTIWGRDKLYTDTTGDVPPFVDWINTMLYGDDDEWVNVECTDCGQLLEGDPRPNPLQEPFGEDGISCPGTP